MMFPLWPDEASLGAQEVDQIMIALVVIGVFFSFSIGGFIIFF